MKAKATRGWTEGALTNGADPIALEDEVRERQSRRYRGSGVRFEIGNLGDQRCHDVFENELGDAVPDVDFEFVLAEIEEENVDDTTVIAVDDTSADRESKLGRKTTARGDTAVGAFGDSD